MELEESKKLFKESIDEAKTPIDLFKTIFDKAYEKGYNDGKNTFDLHFPISHGSFPYDDCYGCNPEDGECQICRER